MSHEPAARPIVWELLPFGLVELVRKVGVKLTLELESDAETVLWPGQYEVENRDPAQVDWLSVRRNFEQIISYYNDMIQSGVIKYKYHFDELCTGNIVFAEEATPNTKI